MTLGHETVGTVSVAAPNGSGPSVGQAVAVNPAETCGHCECCLAGLSNLCWDCRYLGSAARWPHTDGGFVEHLSVPSRRLLPLPKGLDLRRAALAEPASVAWHAINRAEAVGGRIAGARAMVVGAGPIGLLLTAAAIHRGAAAITVIDVYDRPLQIAHQLGANRVLTVSELAASSAEFVADVVFEASGSLAGVKTALRQVRRGGTLVIVGQLPAGDMPIPASIIVTAEVTVAGSLRLGDEFPEVLAFLTHASPAVDSIVSDTLPVDNFLEAFVLAADAGRSSKVLLEF